MKWMERLTLMDEQVIGVWSSVLDFYFPAPYAPSTRISTWFELLYIFFIALLKTLEFLRRQLVGRVPTHLDEVVQNPSLRTPTRDAFQCCHAKKRLKHELFPGLTYCSSLYQYSLELTPSPFTCPLKNVAPSDRAQSSPNSQILRRMPSILQVLSSYREPKNCANVLNKNCSSIDSEYKFQAYRPRADEIWWLFSSSKWSNFIHL